MTVTSERTYELYIFSSYFVLSNPASNIQNNLGGYATNLLIKEFLKKASQENSLGTLSQVAIEGVLEKEGIILPFKLLRHSGYRLVETTITKKDGNVERVSHTTHTIEVLGASVADGLIFNDYLSAGVEGVEYIFPDTNEVVILPKNEIDVYANSYFDYKQTKVYFSNDNNYDVKTTFDKIVANAKLINDLNKGGVQGGNLIPYTSFNNNCNSWTTYIMKRLLGGSVCDWSHIGWNEGANDLSSLNPLNKESQAVARILDVFNDTIASFDSPAPSNPHWDETQLAAGIFDLRFGLEGQDHIITSNRNFTNTEKDLTVSLTADNYHFINKGNNVNVFTGTNEGKIANSGDNCFLATGTGADHILNTGNKVEIYSGSGDDLIINRGSGVTICGGEGADRIFDASEGASTITLGKYVEKDENGQPKNNGTDNDKDLLILRKPANSSTNVIGASAEDIFALYGGNTEPVFSISGGNIVITLGDGSTVTIENGVSVRPDRIYINGKVYISDDDECYREYDSNSDGDLPSTPLIIEILNHSDAILSKIDLAENSVPVLIDPLVFDMDGDGIEIVGASSSDAYFDLTGNGFATRNDWLGGDDTLSGGAGQIGRIAA